MTEIEEILIKIVDKLADDQAIQDFCTAEYGQVQKVFLGGNMKQPPKNDQLPAFQIGAVEKKSSVRFSTYQITIGIVIADEATTTDPPTTATKIYYKGFFNVEKLRQLAEDAIKTLVLGKVTIPESMTVIHELFPIFSATITISIENIISSRR